jgi:hypothetical protein
MRDGTFVEIHATNVFFLKKTELTNAGMRDN